MNACIVFLEKYKNLESIRKLNLVRIELLLKKKKILKLYLICQTVDKIAAR